VARGAGLRPPRWSAPGVPFFDDLDEAAFDLDQDGLGDVLYGTMVYSGLDASAVLDALCTSSSCDEHLPPIGDFDLDGVTDFLLADQTSLSDAQISNFLDLVGDVARVGDVDGDGVPDARVATFGFEIGAPGRLTLLQGPNWTPQFINTTSDHFEATPLGDLTGNGLPEFAGGSRASSRSTWPRAATSSSCS